MTVEIRAVREQELEEMIELQCLVFRPGGHERYNAYLRGDSSYEPGQTRVVVVDGRIAATLRVWDRTVRVGETAVRMGGIGGVGTHPDHRRRGHASALLRDAIDWMRGRGYPTSVLFTEVATEFYRRHGWASVPMPGFRIAAPGAIATLPELGEGAGEWRVEAFDEGRDLGAVMALYDRYNAGLSGSLVRDRAYWDSEPARIRGILPSAVALDAGGNLRGYLNYRIEEGQAEVCELAVDETAASATDALVRHFLRECAAQEAGEIVGELPHRHPVVDLLCEYCGGDLELTGNATTMWKVLDLPRLLSALLPELQQRVEAAPPGPAALLFEAGGERSSLALDSQGRLRIDPRPPAGPALPLSGEMLWRLLLGESGWPDIEASPAARGEAVDPAQSRLLASLFPRRQVIYWAPDHF